MEWIGQHIWDQVSRFRNDVYISPDYAIKSDGKLVLQAANGYDVNILSTQSGTSNIGAKLNLRSDDGAALGDNHLLGTLTFQGAEDTSGTLRQGASISAFADAAWSASENGTRLEFYTMDGDNTSELSLKLDSDLLATFSGSVTVGGTLTVDEVGIENIQTGSESFTDDDTILMTAAAIQDKIEAYGYSTTAGDITGVTAGTGLSGGGSSGAVTLNLDLTSALADATPAHGDGILMLDSDGSTEQVSSVEDLATLYAGTGLTASSSVINVDAAQSGITSLGTLTGLTIDGDKDVTPGDGAMLHIDTSTIRDTATSASGTASLYTHARIEGPTLTATNASVTTTDAATLYVARPVAGTNQTITNVWGIYTNGASRLEGVTNGGNYAQTAGDMTLYDATNDGDPEFNMGSSATERLKITANYQSGTQTMQIAQFSTATASSTANDGRFHFNVDGSLILKIQDAGIDLQTGMGIAIDGTDILTDSSGTATLSNIDAIDATTESTIETAIDTLSNLTTIGTIGTGVWQGTAVATGYTKHLMHYDFQGYGTGDGTNWEISKQVSTNTAPFNHDTSIGSDGLTAQTVQTWIRTGGKVMPKACTLKRITGWSACAGSSTANIGLFKVTPVRENSGTVSAVELADISYTALGNNEMEDHDITSFTATAIAAGDMLFTAVKSQSAKIQYFSLTVEVEF